MPKKYFHHWIIFIVLLQVEKTVFTTELVDLADIEEIAS
jgi:hypothetical protein